MNNGMEARAEWLAEVAALRQRLVDLESHPPAGVDAVPLAMAGAVECAPDSSPWNAPYLMQWVVDNLPLAVFWKDRESLYRGCNRRFAEDAGFTAPAEVIGKSDFDMPWAEEADLYLAEDRQVWESGQPVLYAEVSRFNADGTRAWLRSSRVPLRDANGQIVALLGMLEDITERKLAEKERARLQQESLEAQRQALQELSTPIIPVMDRILVMPLVGNVDSLRAKDIMRNLLAGITEQRARVVILDITGVPLVDSGVANHLNKTIQAARLKGARTIVTGISDAVAETIVDLGIDWSGMMTLKDLQTGLVVALRSLGLELVRRGNADALAE